MLVIFAEDPKVVGELLCCFSFAFRWIEEIEHSESNNKPTRNNDAATGTRGMVGIESHKAIQPQTHPFLQVLVFLRSEMRNLQFLQPHIASIGRCEIGTAAVVVVQYLVQSRLLIGVLLMNEVLRAIALDGVAFVGN